MAAALCAGGLLVPAATAASDHETVAARRLLALVPTELRATCRIVDLQQSVGTLPLVRYARDVAVALQCSPPQGADSVVYVQARSPKAADEMYRKLRPTRHLSLSNRSAQCEATNTYSLGLHLPTVGHDTCYFLTNVFAGDTHPVAIDWTYSPASLYMQSYRSDGDAAELRGWWSDTAGPLQHPKTVGVPETLSVAAATRAYHALLARLPAAVRSTCRRASLGDDAPPAVADARLWVDAAATCEDRAAGIDSTFEHFVTNAALDAEFRRTAAVLGAGAAPASSSSCPSDGTWQHGGVDIGPYSCGYSTVDEGSSSGTVVSYAWADPTDRIFAVAAQTGGELSTLEAWWHDAGPVP